MSRRQASRPKRNEAHLLPDLVIIGAGAAGLMAAARAAEAKVRTVLVERKHLPGRKLLMCGNARCNLTSNLPARAMIEAYGEPSGPFLHAALTAFPPAKLRKWMASRGLPTVVHQDGRVFPKTEKASDVLRVFNDELRKTATPFVTNAPVVRILPDESGWRVDTSYFSLATRSVLLATGGVSYPKTGSVGDGQQFASALGHRLRPYRAGLVGYEVQEHWLSRFPDMSFPAVRLSIRDAQNRDMGETSGELRCERWGITGPCVVNASRLVARSRLAHFTFLVDLLPALSADEAVRHLRAGGGADVAAGATGLLRRHGAAPALAREVVRHFMHALPPQKDRVAYLAEQLKAWRLHPVKSRSLKEAMVTIGGVELDDIDPDSMQSRRCPGLFFAGEIMDMDGPTGGFNLQAAFSTAVLAVEGVRRNLQ